VIVHAAAGRINPVRFDRRTERISIQVGQDGRMVAGRPSPVRLASFAYPKAGKCGRDGHDHERAQ